MPTAEQGHRGWRLVRSGCGVAILAVLLSQLGSAPFLDALAEVTGWPLVIAVAVTAGTTVCCAWRWRVVASGLGVELALPAAVAAYYRSQFLNSTLPGGVLGDAHRAVRHGQQVGGLGRGVRTVAWERTLGQLVQVALTALLLLALPSPARPAAVVVAVVALVGVGIALVVRAAPGRLPGPRLPFAAALVDDLRRILLTCRARPGIVLASAVTVLGHAAVLLVAMRAAGVEAPVAQQVSLTLVVLLGAAVPASVAGWGPREGVAAWAFGAAGLGAATGVTVAVLYGALALLATLPGAVVLVADRRRDEAPSDAHVGAPNPAVGAAP